MFWIVVYVAGQFADRQPAEAQDPVGCAMEAEFREAKGRTMLMSPPPVTLDVVCIRAEPEALG